VSGVGLYGGSSVHFVVASPGNDRDPEMARAWIDGIVKAVNHPAVSSSQAVSPCALGLELAAGRFPLPQPGGTTTPVLDLSDAGRVATQRIPGHTLVLVTPRAADAMILRGVVASTTSSQLTRARLTRFEPWFLAVVPRAGVTLDPRADEAGLQVLLTVLRLGIQSIYLCGFESDGGLGGLAGELERLTRSTVYWNDDPVHFEFTTTPVTYPNNGIARRTLSRVYVRRTGTTTTVADGTPFIGVGPVPLEAPLGNFLPGYQRKVP